ncbi:MAG: glycosyl hydrolase [Candidatus Azobacteroides sp.]|nr:glycosyl hydrolase [Candidatus Azobacteroides sp.]
MKNKGIIIICLLLGSSLFLQAQTRSPKRGVSFNFTNDADLEALRPGTSWFYNWGPTPNNVVDTYNSVYGYEFCPMAWNGNWNSDAIRNYVKAHPDCKYILAFNEPNFSDQANMTPRQAADSWPALKALALELGLKIISPACNYSGWSQYSTPAKWFDEFFQYVDINDVDGIAIHSYMGWAVATTGYVKEYIDRYNKPLWLTEFCAWDNFTQNQGGTALQQRKEMIDMLDYLETEPMVARYAWFIPRRDEVQNPSYPYMELLTNTGGTERGVLTETGMVWTYMSSYDKDFYHNVDACIEAEHYIVKSPGVYMEQTSDGAGVLDVYDYTGGAGLTYNVDVPSPGDYTLRLRALSNTDAVLDITSAKETVTKTVTNTSNMWADREFPVSLNAGKQQITFKITSGNLKLNYFVITNTGATPDPTPNPPGAVVLPPPVGDNLALNKPIESASSTTDLQQASLAVDGNPGTRWESRHGEDNKILIIDLQSTAKLTDIIINWEGAYASQYNVEVSTDQSYWTRIYDTTSGAAGETRITVDNVDARYIKINCIRRGTVYGFSIWEVEAYGTVSATGIATSEKQTVSIYPNPVEKIVYLRTGDQDVKIILSDLNGRKLYEGKNVTFVDMTGYAPGIYLLTVQFPDGEKRNEKIIKK